MFKAKKTRHLFIVLALAVASGSGYARNLPHAKLVNNYLQGEQYAQVLKRCKTRSLIAPTIDSGAQSECWAAGAASDLKKATPAVAAMVLNDDVREATISRCIVLSVEQRFKSAECDAAGHAEAFISLRQPRSVNTLKPVTFK